MNHSSVNYTDICCTGLFDADSELLWTDSKSIINRIFPFVKCFFLVAGKVVAFVRNGLAVFVTKYI